MHMHKSPVLMHILNKERLRAAHAQTYWCNAHTQDSADPVTGSEPQHAAHSCGRQQRARHKHSTWPSQTANVLHTPHSASASMSPLG